MVKCQLLLSFYVMLNCLLLTPDQSFVKYSQNRFTDGPNRIDVCVLNINICYHDLQFFVEINDIWIRIYKYYSRYFSTMADRDLSMGPREGVTYPVRVQYCGNCSMPIEYCEYYPEYAKCKQWLEKNLPTEFEKVKIEEDENAGGEEEKKRQKRGGKGMLKSKKKEDVPKLVQVSRAPRGKKKSVTVVSGLNTFDIDLKVAAKFFGTKFACGSSVTGDDEIVIQGDVKDDLFDIIPEKWPEIDEDSIEDLGDQKR